MNRSLKNMQMDYVDIVLCHRPDFETPMEEICRAFNDVIVAGKAFYWGVSEWPASLIMEAFLICSEHNLIRPMAEQPQ